MCRRYLITGRVQGVGFRQFVKEIALPLHVSGWVRNLPDGAVEAVAQANAQALADFEKGMRAGPRFSQVAAIDTQELTFPQQLPAVFEIRR